MPLFFLFSLVVLIVGFVQKDKKLKTVGAIGILLAVLNMVAILVGFGLSDM